MEYLGISMERVGAWMEYVPNLIGYVGMSSWNINGTCHKLKEYVEISIGYLGISME